MALKALDPLAPFWYTPRAEKDSERATRFKIKGLDGAQHNYVMPEIILDEEKRYVTGLTGKGIDMVFKWGLIDWENLDNSQGPLAFSPRNFHLIDPVTRAELGMQILLASLLKEEEKKT